MSKYNKHIFICINERGPNNPKGDCASCGAMPIRMKFVQLINQNGLKGQVRANKSGCLDACELGAVIVIYPDNIWYTNVSLDDVEEIFETSILNDKIVHRLEGSKKTWQDLSVIRKKTEKI
tara:strand:- start:796 stop:1158 length:363 start_codon:yes stop_codon:yes gene_type:complete